MAMASVMSPSPTPERTGTADSVPMLRPRAVKPSNPSLARVQERIGLKLDNGSSGSLPDMSSGRSTPIPADAPPSAHATSSARKQLRAQQKHRMFPSIDYEERVSHFDPRSTYRDFRGFYVLFWIGLAIMVITTALRNVKETGYPLRHQMWDLMIVKTWQLGLSDAAMVFSTAAIVPFQRMVRTSEGWLRWNRGGWLLQSIFQFSWLLLWINWPLILNWTWTATVCLTLHTLVLAMKMHSYAFYNGHLSHTEDRLSELDRTGNVSKAAVVHYPSLTKPIIKPDKPDEKPDAPSNHPSSPDVYDDVSQLRTDLAFELTSPLGNVTYPANLTMANYADYILCPTLCYELEYPRVPKMEWMELFYKTLAVFGCIFLLTLVSEEFIVPVLHNSALRLQDIDNYSEMGLILAESISELLFPFMVTFLLVFLVIFEYVLGAFAEITRFADRQFYSDWWNSCDWLEFSREWNLPVHHFLRRHVYLASRPYVSRDIATLITFLVSALGHELVMTCITKKLRVYGFLAQMSQLPIVAFQRASFMKGRKLLNNVLFWSSIITGLAMLSALYVLV